MEKMINDFLNSLKGKIVGALVLIVFTFLMSKWEWVTSMYDTGIAVEKQIEFNSNLTKALESDTMVDKLMHNEDFVKNFLNHPTVKEYVAEVGVELKKEVRDEIVEDVMKNDSNKVSMRSFIGKEADIRDEQVLPLLSDIVKAWKSGEITTKEDLDKKLKNYRKVARF